MPKTYLRMIRNGLSSMFTGAHVEIAVGFFGAIMEVYKSGTIPVQDMAERANPSLSRNPKCLISVPIDTDIVVLTLDKAYVECKDRWLDLHHVPGDDACP
jgi:hypothetical protein